MNYNTYKLSDLLETVVDNRGKTPLTVDNGIPLIEINAITGDNAYPNYNVVKKYITEDVYSKFRAGNPQKNDILIGTVGSIGTICLMDDKKASIAQNIIALRTKNIINPVWLYYYLKHSMQEILNLNIGGVQPSIKVPHLMNMDIRVPDKKIQDRIADLLVKIDNKIESNIKLYEEIQLYCRKYFAGILNSNLKNVNEVPLSDYANFYSGYSYKGKELSDESDIGMLTIKNFDRFGGFKIDGFKPIIPEKVKNQSVLERFDIAVACTDLTQKADIAGNPVLLLTKGGYKNIIASMDLMKIEPKNEKYRFFIYELLNSSLFKNFALGYVSGTTVLHMSKKCFDDFKFPEIDEKIIEKTNDILKLNYKHAASLIDENNMFNKYKNDMLIGLMTGIINLNNINL